MEDEVMLKKINKLDEEVRGIDKTLITLVSMQKVESENISKLTTAIEKLYNAMPRVVILETKMDGVYKAFAEQAEKTKNIPVMENDIKDLKVDLEKVSVKAESIVVMQNDIDVIKRLVFGAVGVILLSVLAALGSLVVIK